MRRTTVRLEDALLDQARREAARRGKTLTALIKEGLHLVLAQPKHRRRKRRKLPVSNTKGGPYPGIDIANSASLPAIMEEKG
ncbi:MAG TPA: hypothetical protein VKX39_12745 [Bryobacteraceae bacterium]|nr:hypothetical protein [Bryobacteraceae bacterium]